MHSLPSSKSAVFPRQAVPSGPHLLLPVLGFGASFSFQNGSNPLGTVTSPQKHSSKVFPHGSDWYGKSSKAHIERGVKSRCGSKSRSCWPKTNRFHSRSVPHTISL